jgi:hypothetical protein
MPTHVEGLTCEQLLNGDLQGQRTGCHWRQMDEHPAKQLRGIRHQYQICQYMDRVRDVVAAIVISVRFNGLRSIDHHNGE